MATYCELCKWDGLVIMIQVRIPLKGDKKGWIGRSIAARCKCNNAEGLPASIKRFDDVNSHYFKLPEDAEYYLDMDRRSKDGNA